MAISNALRTNWSSRINSVMRTDLIFDNTTFVNYDYERDAMDANKVHMLTFNDVAAGTYNPATTKSNGTYSTDDGSGSDGNIVINAVTDRRITMDLDQFPYVAWAIEGAHELQINTAAAQAYMQNAGRQLALKREEFIIEAMTHGYASKAVLEEPADIHDTAGANLDIYTAKRVGKFSGDPDVDEGMAVLDPAASGGQSLIKKALQAAAAKMDRYGVPQAGRFFIVPPEFRSFAMDGYDKDTERSEDRIASGWMGRIAGFNVFMSTHLKDYPKAGAAANAGENTWAICGHPSLFTFADQLGGVTVQVHEMERRVRAMRMVASAQYGGRYKQNATLADTVGSSTTFANGGALIQLDTVSPTQKKTA